MQTIKIDFDNPGLPQRLDVVENDAQSRFFKAVLYKDGKAYTAPSGATYSIMYRGFGPQNEGWYDTINDGAGKRAACSVSGNVVTCEIARQALRVPGHVSVVLCVTGSNGYMLHGWPIDCNCRNDSYTNGTSVESFFYITQVTNADWSSAIKTWEELKNMIDPTLSVSGKAADAAKVGTALAEETTRAKAAEEENAKGVSQLKEDKVDYVVNIARSDNIFSEGTLSATAVTNSDRSITVTPTASYGRYDYRFNVLPTGTEKTFYFSVYAETEADSISSVIYVYDGKTNLDKVESVVLKKRNGKNKRGEIGIVRLKPSQYNITNIGIGIMTGIGVPYTITDKSFFIIDITDKVEESDDIGSVFLFYEELFENYRKEKYNLAEKATLAENLLYQINNLNSNGFSANENTCVFTPKANYYGITIKIQNDILTRGDVILVFKSDFYNASGKFMVGQQNKAGTAYDKKKEVSYYGIVENEFVYYCIFSISYLSKLNLDIFYSLKNLGYENNQHTITVLCFGEAVSDTVSTELVSAIINDYSIADTYNRIGELAGRIDESTDKNEIKNTWKGQNVLVIGDSITAAKKWQKKLSELLEMQVTTHAKGGVSAIAMVDGDKGLGGDYDNETSASGVLKPLSTDDVKGKSLIVVLPCYNDRGKPDGKVGDCYATDGTGQKTIAGLVQYTINRIYETLKEAGNLKCKILYVTPHCAGKYPYIDVDGYGEYPEGSGYSMKTIASTITAVCNYNNIPVCNLWSESGIGKFTWNVFESSSTAVNSQYSPYELDSSGNPVNTTRIKYVKGKSYYQIRDGIVVLEEYTGSAPYPYNADQLHCNDEGYGRIGECIVGTIIKHYGN